MDTLSSIPESKPGSSQRQSSIQQDPNTSSSQRARPRSRVIFLSSRSSRTRPRFRRTAKESGSRHLFDQACESQSRDLATNMTERWRRMQDSRRGLFPPAGAISDLDLSSYERLVPSLDMGAFTVPLRTQQPPRPATTCSVGTPFAATQSKQGLGSPTPPDRKLSALRKESSCFPSQNADSVASAVPGVSSGLLHTAQNKNSETQNRAEVDQQLVEAVARNVIQQLKFLSLDGQSAPTDCVADRTLPNKADTTSRTSSQREALDRFTKNLQGYAEHTGVKGKLPFFTPTPTRSSATLHTVSELLPYRPEFRAAGLAVTSKDQAKRPSHPTRACQTRELRMKTRARQGHPSQVDGNDESQETTEISFISPKNASDWRYALIDDLSWRQQRMSLAPKTLTRARCFPCFPKDDDQPEHQGKSPLLHKKTPHHTATRTSLKTRKQKSQPKTPAIDLLGRRSQGLNGLGVSSLSREKAFNFNSNPSSGMAKSSIDPVLRSVRNTTLTDEKTFINPRQPSGGLDGCRPITTPQITSYASEEHGQIARSEDWVERQTSHRKVSRLPSERLRTSHEHERDQRGLLSQGAQAGDREMSMMANRFSSLPNLRSIPYNTTQYPLSSGGKSLSRNIRVSGSILGASNTVHQTDKVQPDGPNGRRTSGICSGGPPRASRARPRIPKRTSSIRGSLRSFALNFSSNGIPDRDVLKGLHIAASAACDEKVDAEIYDKTGLHIRRFLADLMTFEDLEEERIEETQEQRISRRRSEMRRLKQTVRRSQQMRKLSMMTT